MHMQITKDTILSEILKIPGVQEILAKYNVPCLECPAVSLEAEKLKIGDVCQAYGINLEKLLKDLNSVVEQKK